MYAVIRTGGKQYRISPGDKLKVERLEGEAGSTVVFKEVLMVSGDGKIAVGTPIVKDASVKGKLLGTVKDRKVLVFKKKRRKFYRRKKGHRQVVTGVLIEEIQWGGVKQAAAKAEKKAAPVKAKKSESVKSKAAKPEKTPAKKVK